MARHPLQFFDETTGEIMKNSIGYSQVVSTLTAVGRRVSEQRFYEIPFSQYVPTIMGNGAYKRSIINWRTYVKDEGFESGVINNGSNDSVLSRSDAAYDAVSVNILNWSKFIEYSLFELQEALAANNLFSLIEAKEMARKKTWDLGLQKVAFLGIGSETGLLNNSSVTIDSTTITMRLGSMTAAQFNAFVAAIFQAYRAESNYTSKPTHFIIPEADYNSLVNYASETMFTRTKLELLLEAFKTITGNPNFKIMPCQYCDRTQFTTYNRYVLLNYDESSVAMNIPIDYTQTAAGSSNGFTWSNVAFGSFTGVVAIRPKEMLYFANTAS